VSTINITFTQGLWTYLTQHLSVLLCVCICMSLTTTRRKEISNTVINKQFIIIFRIPCLKLLSLSPSRIIWGIINLQSGENSLVCFSTSFVFIPCSISKWRKWYRTHVILSLRVSTAFTVTFSITIHTHLYKCIHSLSAKEPSMSYKEYIRNLNRCGSVTSISIVLTRSLFHSSYSICSSSKVKPERTFTSTWWNIYEGLTNHRNRGEVCRYGESR